MPCKTAVDQRITPRKVTYDGEMYLLHTCGFINTQGGAPLFLFASRGTKMKRGIASDSVTTVFDG